MKDNVFYFPTARKKFWLAAEKLVRKQDREQRQLFERHWREITRLAARFEADEEEIMQLAYEIREQQEDGGSGDE